MLLELTNTVHLHAFRSGDFKVQH